MGGKEPNQAEFPKPPQSQVITTPESQPLPDLPPLPTTAAVSLVSPLPQKLSDNLSLFPKPLPAASASPSATDTPAPPSTLQCPSKTSDGANDPSPTSNNKQQRGRKSVFTPEQELMILREVAAQNAHIESYDQKGKQFESVKNALVISKKFKKDLEGTNVQDRYNRLQKDFKSSALKLSMMSGVGWEVTEAEELLLAMREETADLTKQKESEKERAKAIEDRKLSAGRRIVEMATSRKKKRSSGETGEEFSGAEDVGGASVESPQNVDDGNGDGNRRVKRQRRSKRAASSEFGLDLASFGETIHASDTAQLSLDEQKLALERDRLTFEREEREKDRIERRNEMQHEREMRRDERELQSKVELEKFKLIVDMFHRKIDEE